MQGDYAQSLIYLERANHLVKDEPTVLEHLGAVHQKLGDTRAARKFYRRAIKVRKENPDLINNEENIESLQTKISDLVS
jgi:Flp pilus assembly protein TadD